MLIPKTISPYYNSRLLKNSFFFITGFLILAGIFQGFLLAAKGSNSAVSDNTPRLYHSQEFHYSVSYPANWKVGPIIAGTNVVTISAPANSLSLANQNYGPGSFLSNSQETITPTTFGKIDILAYSLEEPLTAAEFVFSLAKSPLEGQISPRQIAGQTSLLFEPNSTPRNRVSSDDVSYRDAFITKNYQGFIIAGLTRAATFDQILESFQLD